MLSNAPTARTIARIRCLPRKEALRRVDHVDAQGAAPALLGRRTRRSAGTDPQRIAAPHDVSRVRTLSQPRSDRPCSRGSASDRRCRTGCQRRRARSTGASSSVPSASVGEQVQVGRQAVMQLDGVSEHEPITVVIAVCGESELLKEAQRDRQLASQQDRDRRTLGIAGGELGPGSFPASSAHHPRIRGVSRVRFVKAYPMCASPAGLIQRSASPPTNRPFIPG